MSCLPAQEHERPSTDSDRLSSFSVATDGESQFDRKMGYLWRQGAHLSAWEKRWFVLDSEYSATLHSFTDHSQRVKRQSYNIDVEAIVGFAVGSNIIFNLVSKDVNLFARADSYETCISWISSIQSVIDALRTNNTHAVGRKMFPSDAPPTMTRVLNAVLSIPQALSLSYWDKPNDIYSAIRMSKSETGLDDFGFGGEQSIIVRYDTVRLFGLQRSGVKYTALGAYLSLRGVTNQLINRLKLVAFLERHPEVLATKISKPVFVIGLPRTGITLLHGLLGRHPDTSLHFMWEQLHAVPETDDQSMQALIEDRQARYEKGRSEFEMFLELGGDCIQKIHRSGYDQAEECLTPMAMSLPWHVTEIPFNAFAAKELIELGADNAYYIYRKYLQLLTWQEPVRRERAGEFRWVLKCPFHLPYLEGTPCNIRGLDGHFSA